MASSLVYYVSRLKIFTAENAESAETIELNLQFLRVLGALRG